MINPLLHPNSNSAPTSPRVTRTIRRSTTKNSNQARVSLSQTNSNPSGGSNPFGVILRRFKDENSESSNVLDENENYEKKLVYTTVSNPNPQRNFTNLVRQVPIRDKNGRGNFSSEISEKNRRLSRLVKCRTLDFTELPEGMREYYSDPKSNSSRNSKLLSKVQIRESRSQPGSPIPVIQIQDFGSEPPTPPSYKRSSAFGGNSSNTTNGGGFFSNFTSGNSNSRQNSTKNSNSEKYKNRQLASASNGYYQGEVQQENQKSEKQEDSSEIGGASKLLLRKKRGNSDKNRNRKSKGALLSTAISLPSKINQLSDEENERNSNELDIELNKRLRNRRIHHRILDDNSDDDSEDLESDLEDSIGLRKSNNKSDLEDNIEDEDDVSELKSEDDGEDGDEANNDEEDRVFVSSGSNERENRRGNKLKRRKAYYSRQRVDLSGRSKSLTSIDAFQHMSASASSSTAVNSPNRGGPGQAGSGMGSPSGVNRAYSGSGGGDHDRLVVPARCDSAGASTDCNPANYRLYQRRRKLSTAGKVSSSEFLTVSFEGYEGDRGHEEFMPATRGTCLREAISTVCERMGVDVDSINVFLENANTPLPLLTTETAWLGGKQIRVRAKDDSKSPYKTSNSGGGGLGSGLGGSERISVTAPPSRKASAVSQSGRTKTRLFNSSSTATDDAAAANSNGSAGGNNSNHHPHLTSQTSSALSTSFGGIGSSNPQNSLSALNIAAMSFDRDHRRPDFHRELSSDGRLSADRGGPNQKLGSASTNDFKDLQRGGEKVIGKATNRWSGLWGSTAKESKMAALVQQLDTYSKIGIPKFSHQNFFPYEDEVEEALYSLEDDWRDIVDVHCDFLSSERARSQQTAIWELVETEVAYIRTLKVLHDLFLNCLCNLQSSNILTEIDVEKLFCNIHEIYSANRSFWHHYLFPMVKRARETEEPLDPNMMMEGFLRFDDIFSPYSRYCSEQANCLEYCKDQDRANEVFKAYLAWCETQRDCNRLRLVDILVRPMQRLTRYSLLLKAVLKKSDDEDLRSNLTLMEERVECFVSDVNSHLRQRQEQERLKTIIARIEAYEPVETKDEELDKLVQSHCHFDLTSPMPGCSSNFRRQLLFEGDLKFKEGLASKIDVHVFLFTDILLVCKNLTKKQTGLDGKVKIIRPPYIVDRLISVDVSQGGSGSGSGSSSQGGGGLAMVYLNEFGVVASAFTLHAPESKMVKAWREQLQKAKDMFEESKVETQHEIYSRHFLHTAAAAAAGGHHHHQNHLTAANQAVKQHAHNHRHQTSCSSNEDCPAAISAAMMAAMNNNNNHIVKQGSGTRRNSSRGSRLSSIGHSYSGSVDINEFMSQQQQLQHSQNNQLTPQHQVYHLQQQQQLNQSVCSNNSCSGCHQQQPVNVRRNRSFELKSQNSLGLASQPAPPPNSGAGPTPPLANADTTTPSRHSPLIFSASSGPHRRSSSQNSSGDLGDSLFQTNSSNNSASSAVGSPSAAASTQGSPASPRSERRKTLQHGIRGILPGGGGGAGSASSVSQQNPQQGSATPGPATPNTLSVQIPYGSAQVQQSMPNLITLSPGSAPAVSNRPQYQPNRDESPSRGGRPKSPTARGISYPPVSPKFQRGVALQPSNSVAKGNPPLSAKSRHVLSTTGPPVSSSGTSDSKVKQSQPNPLIPVIAGISPPSEDNQIEEQKDNLTVVEGQHQAAKKHESAASTLSGMASASPNNSNIDVNGPGKQQRIRSDRAVDSRRYHTAGVIEDIKKQDVKQQQQQLGEAGIQKRLSWNYGQHIPNNELQVKGALNKNVSKTVSTDSIQSSSGVSSTGSLHLSIGSGDNSTTNQQQRLALANQKLPPNPPPSPSISLVVNTPSPPQTTPVKPLPPKPLGASPSHPPLKMGPAATSTPTKAPGTKPTPPPVPPRQSTNARPVIQATPQQQQQQLIQDHHHISTTYITQDDVVITSGAGAKTKQNQANSPNSSGKQKQPNQQQIKEEATEGGNNNNMTKFRDILLMDNNVESSNV